MNPLMLYRSLPYIVIVILIAALTWTTSLYLGKRDELAALTASVQVLGQAAQKRVEEVQKQSEVNLKTVKENHEKLEAGIRASAVRNYLSAHPASRVRVERAGGGSMSTSSKNEQVDDRASEELVPDRAFIEAAAEDAIKLSAWQEWARLNNVPVEGN